MRTNRAAITSAGIFLLCACNDTEATGIEDLADTPSFAVQLSDYESAGVALIDGDGKLLSAKYVSSATALPGLSASLHGDIALPTTPCDPTLLTVIARSGGDYVLQIDLENAEVVRQVRTQGDNVQAAYSGNPQDALCLDDGTMWVSRFEPNLAAAAGMDGGDDLIVIGEAGIDARIDLAKVRGKAMGFDADGNAEEQTAYARPSSIVRVGDRALVSTSRLTLSWTAASGMLAVVDLDTREVEGIALPGLFNCSSLTQVAGRDDAVLVSCYGSPYGDAATAGLAIVSLDAAGEATIERTYMADSGEPALFANVTSLGGSRVYVVATGDFTAGTGDQGFLLDLATGESTPLLMSTGPGVLGTGAYRSETGLLLVPDAEKGVHLFEVTDEGAEESGLVAMDAALPARSVRPLR
jgi:hypothetical protein